MKKESMYGYPLSSIIFRTFILMFFLIIIFYLGAMISSFILLFSFLLIPISYYLFKSFKNHFLEIRIKIINDMMKQVKLHGNERILDLGTGSGYAAIPFARKVPNGLVIGVDKYNLKNKRYFQRYREKIKINFFGNSLHNALKNSTLENVSNICFIKTDLIESMPFHPESFDVIIASQLLYCIPKQNLKNVLSEINRVLSKTGCFIFFESIGYKDWNIHSVQDFFKIKYEISIIPLDYIKNMCILIGRRNKC